MKHVTIVEPKGAPYVPPTKICRCYVPHLRSGHDYFSGWGVTYCAKCNRHYAFGVSFARSHAYVPRLGGKKE